MNGTVQIVSGNTGTETLSFPYFFQWVQQLLLVREGKSVTNKQIAKGAGWEEQTICKGRRDFVLIFGTIELTVDFVWFADERMISH
jgi:hypothetical protein